VSIPNEIDAGIARALLLRAVRTRAAAKDEAALNDIIVALTDLDLFIAEGAWFELVRKAIFLLEKAEGRWTALLTA
jgi:hypothetical protein